MELDNVLVPIIANRERGALVAVHMPSFVEDVKNVTICTYEEIQELMSNQQELSVPLVVIQPKKIFSVQDDLECSSLVQSFHGLSYST